MGVVYIGDRETGKTALAVELIDPKKGRIKVEGQNYDNLKKILYDEDTRRNLSKIMAKTKFSTLAEVSK